MGGMEGVGAMFIGMCLREARPFACAHHMTWQATLLANPHPTSALTLVKKPGTYFNICMRIARIIKGIRRCMYTAT